MSKKIYNQPIYKLRDCIPSNKLNEKYISANPSPVAMKLLLKPNNIPYINWNELSLNPSDEAMDILETNPDKINGDNLSLNANDKAFHLLEKYPTKINWKNIFLNKNTDKAIDLLIKFPTNIKIDVWPININDIYIDYLEENFLDKIQWEILTEKIILNPCDKGIILILKHHAILIEHYKEKEKYKENICMINDDRIIHLLKKYPNSIIWSSLVKNPNNKLIDLIIYLESIKYRSIKHFYSPRKEIDIYTEDFWNNLMQNKNADTIIYIMKKLDFKDYICNQYKCHCLKILVQHKDDKILKFFMEKKFMDEKNYTNILSRLFRLNDNDWFIHWTILYSLCLNSNDSALRILKNNKKSLYCNCIPLLAQNTNKMAFDLLQELFEKPNRINDFENDFWISICKNKSPHIFEFIKNNFHRINLKQEKEEIKKAFQHLLFREDSIDFVEYYLDNERIKNLYLTGNTLILDNFITMLDWNILSQNPGIFILDKEAMLNNFEPLGREIINYPQQKMERLIENRLEIRNVEIEDNLLTIFDGIIENKQNKIKEENSDDENTSNEDAESI
jgi:hypothetical protein